MSTFTLSNVTTRLNRLFPVELAEKWDNVGLLVQPSEDKLISSILLTNDLTEKVLDEAVELKVDLIYSYHPPLFKSFKRLQMSNWKDRLVIKCLENKIAIYSPHTSIDATQGGVNDWLVSCLPIATSDPVWQSVSTQLYDHCLRITLREFGQEAGNRLFETFKNMDNVSVQFETANVLTCKCNKKSLLNVQKQVSEHTKDILDWQIFKTESPMWPNHGMGRVVSLKESIKLNELIETYKKHLNLPHLRLALGKSHALDTPIRKVAVCAGSGATVLDSVSADLLVTGEMSHHEVLDAVHRNQSIILAEHTNTERGYLKTVQKYLEELFEKQIKVVVSTTDRDPLEVV